MNISLKIALFFIFSHIGLFLKASEAPSEHLKNLMAAHVAEKQNRGSVENSKKKSSSPLITRPIAPQNLHVQHRRPKDRCDDCQDCCYSRACFCLASCVPSVSI